MMTKARKACARACLADDVEKRTNCENEIKQDHGYNFGYLRAHLASGSCSLSFVDMATACCQRSISGVVVTARSGRPVFAGATVFRAPGRDRMSVGVRSSKAGSDASTATKESRRKHHHHDHFVHVGHHLQYEKRVVLGGRKAIKEAQQARLKSLQELEARLMQGSLVADGSDHEHPSATEAVLAQVLQELVVIRTEMMELAKPAKKEKGKNKKNKSSSSSSSSSSCSSSSCSEGEDEMMTMLNARLRKGSMVAAAQDAQKLAQSVLENGRTAGAGGAAGSSASNGEKRDTEASLQPVAAQETADCGRADVLPGDSPSGRAFISGMEPAAVGGHVAICMGGGCRKRGAQAILAAVENAAVGCPNVQVSTCKCLGKCGRGANMEVFSDLGYKVTESKLDPATVTSVFQHHFGSPASSPVQLEVPVPAF
eukprot:jgi/Mesvir1/27277/Mv07111-RA.1